jgi:hypothetical protein
MCVHEIHIARRRCGRTPKRPEKRRQERHAPRLRAHIPNDAVPVRDTEVREGRRRNDADVYPALTGMLDRIGDEPTCNVVRTTRVRRRQDENLQRRLAGTSSS